MEAVENLNLRYEVIVQRAARKTMAKKMRPTTSGHCRKNSQLSIPYLQSGVRFLPGENGQITHCGIHENIISEWVDNENLIGHII